MKNLIPNPDQLPFVCLTPLYGIIVAVFWAQYGWQVGREVGGLAVAGLLVTLAVTWLAKKSFAEQRKKLGIDDDLR